ncbi:uncharacterized protein LOC115757915 isoform X1 [Drosophila novamexicana]|uniref:uncharacterized protein LOC115757915 isoform X1 n=1 Tax=Drosophila novamexicana TaxID=47314 RepID=UPI0011E59D45|nr:uncharacterized protein LOC115757915 isoform X1 [Drosophila novamexicana]
MAETNNKKRKPLQDDFIEIEPQAMDVEPQPAANENAAKEEQAEPPAEEPTTVDKTAKKSRVRAKKTLRPSVIRRICQIPSKESKELSNNDAEVMYTNSQFGQLFDPCSRSACNMCTLAPRRRTKIRNTAKTRSKSKPKRSAAASKRKMTAKVKRHCTTACDRRLAVKSLLNFEASNRSMPTQLKRRTRQCLCTELNGQVYKLMDLPNGVHDGSSLMLSLRRRQLKRTLSKPRLATKRIVGKRPTNGRKVNKN